MSRKTVIFALGVVMTTTTTTTAAVASPPAPAPVVWAIDDGEKIKENEIDSPFASGKDNPIWSPGQPIRLFALKNETIAFQVVVQAGVVALDGVTVDLEDLICGPSGTGPNEVIDAPVALIRNEPEAAAAKDPTSYVGRPIEKFREHFFDVKRASGGKTPRMALQWAKNSGPMPPERWLGRIPDALIPAEVAPSWLPYPMAVAPQSNAIIWFDITVSKTQPTGRYKSNVVVKARGAAAPEATLATLPVELDIIDATMPDLPLKTMLYYGPEHVDRRVAKGDGSGKGATAAASLKAEENLWKLYHRHRIQPVHSANNVAEAEHHLHALDGSLFTKANGYEGPGEGKGDGLLALGMYGAFGDPDASKMKSVENIADFLQAKKVLESTDTFVYAEDEICTSPRGAAWKKLMAASSNANAKKVRLAWTCSEHALKQPVDIPIQVSFDGEEAARANAIGKELWIYNGRQPQTASFTTDAPAINPRANGWIQAMAHIGRWFLWESTFWYDGNKGGKGPYDPFISAETFHNSDNDYGIGDGVMVYPGKQLDMFTEHSVGIDGVIASIRLKNWRRGIQDAGYLQLAWAINATKTDAVARRLLPVTLSDAKDGDRPSWSDSGKAWFEARKVLLAIIQHNDGAIVVEPPPPRKKAGGCAGCETCAVGGSSPSSSSSLSLSRFPADFGDAFVVLAVLALLRAQKQRPTPGKVLSWKG